MSRPILLILFALCAYGAATAQVMRPPRIWDDAALADWATPVAGLNIRPAHYSSVEYYAAPVDNLKTYPFYPVDREPPGYWEWLQKQTPQPLIDAKELRTNEDWIVAGERAFHELDAVLVRTKDPNLMTRARALESLQGVPTLSDGSFAPLRWVVTPDGLMLSAPACGACHTPARSRNDIGGGENRAQAGDARERAGRRTPLTGPGITARRLLQFYAGDALPVALWKEFTVPWNPDERVERLKTMTVRELQSLNGSEQFGRSFGNGVFARANGSPYYTTRVPDLRGLRYSRYLDATATHRLRGPEDIARYAALVTGADRMEYGPQRILADSQRRVRFRYADEALYAIGVYLMSLEPPSSVDGTPATVLERGEQIFRREGCQRCHPAPNYTTGALTLAAGWKPTANHPNRDDILDVTLGTDVGAALKTRKGTGLYKIPSLRGVGSRRLLLHDGSLTSLEELFDPARLNPDYEPKGWNPPGVNRRAVSGHELGLSLSTEEKAALLAFVRSR